MKKATRLAKSKHIRLFIYLIGFGIIGGLIIYISFAATGGSYSVEPETGTVSSSVSVVASASGVSGGYVQFNAASGGINPALLGLARPFASTSPWNTPTPSGTQWFNNNVLHSYNGGGIVWWGNNTAASVYYGTSSDPTWTYNLLDFIDLSLNRNRHATTITGVHAPTGIVHGDDSDQILVIVDSTTGTEYETWDTTINSAARTITGTGWAVNNNLLTAPGAGTSTNNDGVRAANFSWLAGLITGHDLTSGNIDHTLVLGLPAQMLKGAQAFTWVAPATAYDNGGGENGPIKMGSRVGIPAGVAKPAGLTTYGSLVFDALQKYGAFVGDYVGGPYPVLYADRNTVTGDMQSEYLLPTSGHPSSSMSLIEPLLRVADYQP